MTTLSELRESPHWSFSSLDSLLNRCSLQWAFNHVYRVERERASIALPFGSAFHAAASVLARSRMNGTGIDMSQVQDAFSDWWTLEVSAEPLLAFEDGESADVLNEQGRGLAALLIESIPEDVKVMEVAAPFSVAVIDSEGRIVSDKPLIGEMDVVVIEPDGQVTIVDWKTSARRWAAGKADESLQATCMTYAHDIEVGGIPGFRFDVFVKNKKPVFEMHRTTRTREDFHRLAELVRMADRLVAAEAYFPRIDWQCGSCPYASECRDWHRKAARTTSVGSKAA